jgi:hypothetical protein
MVSNGLCLDQSLMPSVLQALSSVKLYSNITIFTCKVSSMDQLLIRSKSLRLTILNLEG